MSEQTVNFGKYTGLKFKDLIEKDPNYALWITSFKIINDRNKELYEYLLPKKQDILNVIKERKLDQIKKQFS